MAPSHINTAQASRPSTDSFSRSSSAASSPTLSLGSRSSTATSNESPASSSSTKLLGRLRSSPRSRSPSPRPRASKRNSGTTMQVGRHSNEWLFGGFSFTDAVRDLLRHDDNGRSGSSS